MDAQLERRALDLIDEVLEAEPQLQDTRLTEVVAAHPELADLLHRLFRADRAGRPALPTEHAVAAEPGLPPPERIGPYRLTRRLGAGGMGEVYLGERDDALFEQAVAIKLIRPGAMSTAAASQFAVERGILARLRHPNISQLFDGGTDPDGRAYIVMELLSGETITRRIAGSTLSLRDSVALLLPVCAAVQHAHQASIVHADIKPGNVLVGDDGVVKLLDFGIARHLDEAGEMGPLALTPAYASPARRANEPPTPADDVYALGALLFEIVAGRPPSNRLPIGAPSQALRAETAGDNTGLKRAREADGDLDAIVAKACALAPADRYQSAEALADDLRRWLERRPVRARPLDWGGAAVRFVQRHPWAMTATAGASAALIAAVVVTGTLYMRAEEQRKVAEQRFEDVRRLARFMMLDVVDRLESLPGAAPLRRDIASAGRDYVQRLSATAGAEDPDLQFEIASGYGQVGRALGASSVPSLGDTTAGAASLARSETILRDLHRRAPQRADIAIEFARVLTWRGASLDAAENDGAAANARHAEARKVLDEVIARDPSNTAAQYARWSAVLAQVDRWAQENRHAEIIALIRDMQRRASTLPTPPQNAAMRPMLEAGLSNDLGDALYFTGDIDGALASYMAAVGTLEARRLAGPADVRLIDRLIGSYFNVSSTLSTHGRPREALVWAEKGVAAAQDLLTFDQSSRSLRMAQIIGLQHAVTLSELGRHDAAIASAIAGVEDRRRRAEATPEDRERQRIYAASVRPLGEIYERAGRPAQACATYRIADQAWARLGRGSALPPYDRDEIRLVKTLLARC